MEIIFKEWSDMVIPASGIYETGSNIYDRLQAIEYGVKKAKENTITIVKLGQHESLNKVYNCRG